MSDLTRDDARERRMRSLDIIKVHNTTGKDIIIWHDKLGPERRKVVIPGNNKDIGKGKGNADLPRYLAQRFTKKLIEQIITKKSDEAWAERKKELRMLPKAEMLSIAETEPIRTNDVKSWDELLPKIWLGVVEKYDEDISDEFEDESVSMTGNSLSDAMENAGLADKPYEEEKI